MRYLMFLLLLVAPLLWTDASHADDAVAAVAQGEKKGVASTEPVALTAEEGASEKGQPESKLSEVKQSEVVPAIDVEALTERLKKSRAIGLFTKLAIRNDIVDLLDRIKLLRKKKQLKQHLAEIRASYDGLLLKIVALLDEDPDLSRDLYVSREAIWKSLLEVKA